MCDSRIFVNLAHCPTRAPIPNRPSISFAILSCSTLTELAKVVYAFSFRHDITSGNVIFFPEITIIACIEITIRLLGLNSVTSRQDNTGAQV